ncbi:aspartate/glutamate racemase family protein [Salisediminibacterium halotolerans]|uniref:Aspartate racemase n=1 Tax=Salisediminibacterium halotolerans TaxID=517425 RepID=A0A1H9W8J4_9BACI|nr:aspartate/glutamate racemase family protein [Salisediminibacterium haloalkalitolerans]SES30111.1 aspartate racemase [Salisediminibacterium haloalkalitolerans]
MKTIGMIGGMSWESTMAYYRWVNEMVQKKLGKLHSLPCLISSVDFQPLAEMQHNGDWDKAAAFLGAEAQKLEQSGAEAVMLCTNTMHAVADQIENAVSIPLLHIADAASHHVHRHGLTNVVLLGTSFTMEQRFYRDRLASQGIETVIPDAMARERVHKIIFDELCLGITENASRDYLLDVIHSLVNEGSEGVLLGCTELSMLLKQSDLSVPLFDTTKMHAGEAVRFALSG